ncbi:hypothetical protein ACUY2L_04615 [Corynebacterium mastitidis]
MGRRGTTGTPGATDIPTDSEMVRLIWPCLAAAALGLVPFTVFSNFLVAIAEEAHTEPALLGSLRGLGGMAALAVSVAFAPLLDHAYRGKSRLCPSPASR